MNKAMMRVKKALIYFLIIIISFIISIPFVWYFAVPVSLIKDSLEGSVSAQNSQDGISVSTEGLRKGFLFTVHADRIDFQAGRAPSLSITNISVRINPFYLLKKQFVFSIKGTVGTGNIDGSFRLPASGEMALTNIEINAIPYLTSLGLKGEGFISGKAVLKNNAIDVLFEIPDAALQDAVIKVPLPLSWFNKIQGVFSITGNAVRIDSMTFEGEKGFARSKGSINNGIMDLELELMPDAGYFANERESLELALIRQYRISPGYYLIPVKGPV
ncbi:MAG: type II secretion system protein GspN [Nitrospirae bacterium]|nr:type II secretion system protein GspN [Nitrospirota bacterium]